MNPTKQEQTHEAHEAYEAIVDPALIAYRAIVDPADKAYEAIVDSALIAYRAIADPAYKTYRTKLKEINAQPDKVETVITHNGREYKLMEDK